jgi:hypothetical protein
VQNAVDGLTQESLESKLKIGVGLWKECLEIAPFHWTVVELSGISHSYVYIHETYNQYINRLFAKLSIEFS